MALRNHLLMVLFVSLAVAISLSLDHLLDPERTKTMASKEPVAQQADASEDHASLQRRHD